MDSCFLLGMILEVLRYNFRLETNFHYMLFPYFLYPLNSIALTFSVFMTISIAFERYDAMHNIAQHNQVRANSLYVHKLHSGVSLVNLPIHYRKLGAKLS